MTLTARPVGFFSWSYDVEHNGAHICSVDLAWFREAGSFRLNGRSYRIGREPMWGAFVLHGPEGELCRATKPSAFSRAFHVELEGHSFRLAPVSPFHRSFILSTDSRQVGSIRPRGLFSRRVIAELPRDMPVAEQVFLLWLVIVIWRRHANTD